MVTLEWYSSLNIVKDDFWTFLIKKPLLCKADAFISIALAKVFQCIGYTGYTVSNQFLSIEAVFTVRHNLTRIEKSALISYLKTSSPYRCNEWMYPIQMKKIPSYLCQKQLPQGSLFIDKSKYGIKAILALLSTFSVCWSWQDLVFLVCALSEGE